ncbi:MAG: hypothetical protein R3F35_12635 [Myxococcota bacterium]
MQLDTGDARVAAASRDEAAFLHALRLRAAEALERAYGFLEGAGDAWARLRARVLCGASPPAELVDRIVAAQEPDGRVGLGTLVAGGAPGFPAIDLARLGDDARAILGTLEAFLVAADAGVLHGAWVESAARALEARQALDGAFRVRSGAETSSGSSAVGEDDASSDVFFTGMVAGMLGRTPFSRPATLERAGAFLAERFSPDAVENGYSALLAYSLFFTNAGHERADEALQWCGRALEKGFRSRRNDALVTLRVLLSCDAQAMPGASFDVVELLERLLEEQARDGGFAELALGGPAARTTQTFDAMLAIVRLCAALGVAEAKPV